MDSDLAAVCALERELQTPHAREDPARVAELLDAEFVEIGASGRRWDRDSMIELLRRESDDPHADKIEVRGLHGRVIAPGVIHVMWESARGGRRARRSSIWRRSDGGWRLVFHQGTPVHD